MHWKTRSVAIVLLWPAALALAGPGSRAFTYQGQLKQNGQTLNGVVNLVFSLHDAPSGGNLVGTQAVNDVVVSRGLFTVTLNGAGQFDPDGLNGQRRWLEIAVDGQKLAPRQEIIPVPYASLAFNVPDASITSSKIVSVDWSKITNAPAAANAWLLGGNIGTDPTTHFVGTKDPQPLNLQVNSRRVMRFEEKPDAGGTLRAVNVLGGSESNSIGSNVIGATIAGGGLRGDSGADAPNDIQGDFGFIGGGSGNFIDAVTYGTIGGGTGNNLQGGHSVIGGGTGNNIQSDSSTIAGGSSNFVFGASAALGGGSGNTITAGLATIAGGDANSVSGDGGALGGGQSNAVTAPYATVAGGFQNSNGGQYGTIGGGAQNEVKSFLGTIAGGSQNEAAGQYASIGGGSRNAANADTATIAGGDQNTVNGTFTSIAGGRLNYAWSVSDFSAIGGGYSNTVYGDFATIPGGYRNYADGLASLAAGYRAYAAHDGSFVWGDAHEQDFVSTAPNQFCIRATGGLVLEAFNNVPVYTGVGSADAGRYLMLLNSPKAPSASGLKAGGILCSDSFAYANPGKNELIVKGSVGVGYNFAPTNYALAVNGSVYALNGYFSSDARYKSNAQTFDRPLETILKLRGITFEWRREEYQDQHFPAGRQVGFVAQEVEEVLPELVMTDEKGYKAVAYTHLVPVLVEAVKQQQLQIDDQRKQISERDARIAAMEAQLAQVVKRLDQMEQASTGKDGRHQQPPHGR